MAYRNSFIVDTEELSASLKCQEILLEAGADPTIVEQIGIELSLHTGTTVSALWIMTRRTLILEQRKAFVCT